MSSEKKMHWLPTSQFSVLKIIRVQIKSDVEGLKGWVFYLRKYREDYTAEGDDFLDRSILEGIQKVYLDSRLIVSKNIFFEGQLGELLSLYSGNTDEKFTINFVPKITAEYLKTALHQELYSHARLFYFVRTSKVLLGEKAYLARQAEAEIPFEKMQDFYREIALENFKELGF